MNKKEFIKEVAKKTGCTKKMTTKILDGMVDVITNTLEQGDEVYITEFGRFLIKTTKARQVRHPIEGNLINLPLVKSVKFRPTQKLKDILNK